jgi:site-specific recombinase XerC
VQVAQVLRHDDLATTAVYAKVDFGMLSEAVAGWPQVTP